MPLAMAALAGAGKLHARAAEVRLINHAHSLKKAFLPIALRGSEALP